MKIYADCADLKTMVSLVHKVQGFTTNPTLMRQAGVKNYEAFAREALKEIPLPISFEVIADTLPEMEVQASQIHSWGKNAVVKIPITNTRGRDSVQLVENLLKAGISVNVTAIMTIEQLVWMSRFNGQPLILSVFAGRVADAGCDPIPLIKSLRVMYPTELLWASTRELFNIQQAESAGCAIITLSPELIRKIGLIGKRLSAYSEETVKQFYDDAKEAGYTL